MTFSFSYFLLRLSDAVTPIARLLPVSEAHRLITTIRCTEGPASARPKWSHNIAGERSLKLSFSKD